jgi:hypothetical protein
MVLFFCESDTLQQRAHKERHLVLAAAAAQSAAHALAPQGLDCMLQQPAERDKHDADGADARAGGPHGHGAGERGHRTVVAAESEVDYRGRERSKVHEYEHRR